MLGEERRRQPASQPAAGPLITAGPRGAAGQLQTLAPVMFAAKSTAGTCVAPGEWDCGEQLQPSITRLAALQPPPQVFVFFVVLWEK